MDTNLDDIDLDRLKRLKWKTNLSRKVEQFRDVISDDEVFEKYFGEEYVNRLSEKSSSINGLIIKLGIVYTILMLSLYSSQYAPSNEFEVFGYGFKNLSSYKEFLLLLAALISPVSSIYSAYRSYIDALINECLSKMAPDTKVREFYKQIWFNDYFETLIVKRYSGGHGVTTFLVGLFALILFFLLMTLVLASFFIQVNVIYDVAKNPSTSEYINLFVVAVSISSIIFTWLVSIMQLPMPETNYGMYDTLDNLEKSDPEKHKQVMKKLSDEDSKRDVRNTIVLSSLSYLICYTVVSILWFSNSMDDMSVFLAHALPGAFFTMFFSNEALGFIRKRGINWFFRTYPLDSPERLTVFGRMRFVFSTLKVIVPTIITAGYAFYSLS